MKVETKLNGPEIKIITEYIHAIEQVVEEFNKSFGNSEDVWELLVGIAKILEDAIPGIKENITFQIGREQSDAELVRKMLIFYLAENNIEYKERESEQDSNLKRFWASFILWFENELMNMDMLQPQYIQWDNWNGGTYCFNLDYNYEFMLKRGITYPDSLKNGEAKLEDIKLFLELAYKHWIIAEGSARYQFTIEVNERFKIFKMPYRMQNGIVLKQGYKTTNGIDKIVNYRMFERKIRFSEDMINSQGLMEKKSALDFVIDALQYLVSLEDGARKKQYGSLALKVHENSDSKVYAVVKKEVEELMKMSNEYFDIRHNDYLNAAKETREALNDSQFIEYLYNRAYALLYLLRLKNGADLREK